MNTAEDLLAHYFEGAKNDNPEMLREVETMVQDIIDRAVKEADARAMVRVAKASWEARIESRRDNGWVYDLRDESWWNALIAINTAADMMRENESPARRHGVVADIAEHLAHALKALRGEREQAGKGEA